MASKASSMTSSSVRCKARRSRAAGLVITNSHVMSPLIERNEIFSLESAHALRYRGFFIEGWNFVDIPEQRLCGHILRVFRQIAHLRNSFFEQLGHAESISYRP